MLRRKLFRDLWQNRTQFLSIFLMAFLGLFVFAGIDAESNGIGLSTDYYYEETHLADNWVVGAGFSSEEQKAIEKLEQVESVDRKAVLSAKAKVGNGEELDMELNFLESINSSFPYWIEGEEFTADAEGIWLEELFAKEWDLKVGDYITLEYEGREFTEQIKGIIIHPEYIFYMLNSDSMMPTYGQYGYGFLSAEEFPMQEGIVYNRLVIKQNANAENCLSENAFKEKIKNVLDRDDVVVLDRSQNTGLETIASEQEQHAAMGIMFSAVFLLIAVMGIVTTMTRMTSNQRIQIGTLKALGFSKRKITWHYVSYGMVISAAGSILGAVIGPLTLPYLFLPSMTASYILPEWRLGMSDMSYYAIVLSVIVSTIVSFLSCRKELRDMPAITLKPAAPKNIRHSMLEKSKLWLSMNFSSQWNMRDIRRNKARSLMGIAGVAGCTMLLVCAFGMKDCIDEFIVWQYGGLITGQYKLMFAESTSDLEKEEYAQQFKGQLVQEGNCEFRKGDVVKSGSVTIIEDGNYIHYQEESGDEIAIPEYGVALSVKMAMLLDLELGDSIEWHLVGEEDWEKTRITALYRTPIGQGITIHRKSFEAMQYDFLPTSLYTNMSIPDYVEDSDEISGVISIEQLKSDLDENMEMMNIMVAILILAAVVLGVIVLYNMGVLSFMEKTREIATLKVLGFSSSRIRKILGQQNAWITIMGIVVGLVLGYWFLDLIMQTMSEDYDMPTIVYMMTYVYSVIGTWIVSTGVNRMLSGKVKTICMVDALKGVE
ncbi:MAG: FtsX-like permease family protein [Lachnospiraceae bacterium]|nr:FtsX-like permease family protein [Lachnospiraceae bacterium]